MDQKEIFALAILIFAGVALIGGCVIFIQYQSSKMSLMSPKKPTPVKIEPAAPPITPEDKQKEEQGKDQDIIKNFDECVAAGNPVMESYPARCKTADGKTFAEDIGNEMELTDLIIIYSPRPNAKIASPLTISGKARGSWFFEADFPVKLLDAAGNIIASGIAVTQSEWMTQDFVEFLVTLEFEIPPTASGKLILEKDNPSGLPEHDNQLIVPIKF